MLNSKYKIVFCDIDGTLVDDNKYMTEETKVNIKKLVDNGIHFVLTSGKNFSIIKTFSLECGAMPYAIGSNGAIVYDYSTNKAIYLKSIDKKTALDVIDFARLNDVHILVSLEEGKGIVEETKYGFAPKNRKDIVVVNSVKEYVEETEEQILKIAMIDPSKEKVSNMRNLMNENFDLNVVQADVFIVPERFKEEKDKGVPNPYLIETMNRNVSKAEAIKKLIAYLNIDLSETVAIGDGTNDYDMLNVVNFKIAMGNAVEEVKNIADMITDSNNDSGVAKAINKLFFE